VEADAAKVTAGLGGLLEDGWRLLRQRYPAPASANGGTVV
jgi:hypothetical protein